MQLLPSLCDIRPSFGWVVRQRGRIHDAAALPLARVDAGFLQDFIHQVNDELGPRLDGLLRLGA